MSEEPLDDTLEDLGALDSLLHKYGASSSASKRKQEQNEESLSVAPQIPSKSFLQEIQERAQILSVQRERSAKKTLQTIVKEPKSQHSDDLDDFVKLIRSAPISDDLYQPKSENPLRHSSPTYTRPGPEPETSTPWSDRFSLPTHVLLDIDNKESKDYSDDSESDSDSEADSDLTVTEETDAESEASDLNYTWELNTDLEGESIQAQSSGYFELDSLEDAAESSTDTDAYFHLPSLDDTDSLIMAEPEQPVSVPEDEVQEEVVALSDDESVPTGDEADGGDENVMEVDDSKKSFKTTLGDEKALDAVIDDMSEQQNTAQEEDDIVSGDETTNIKKPASDEDDGWVMLNKESAEKSMEVDDKEDVPEIQDEEEDNVDRQDKEDSIETKQDIVESKEDISDEDAQVFEEDEHKDKKMKLEEDVAGVKDEAMESLKDEDDSASEEEAVDASEDTPTDSKNVVESSEAPPEDIKEEKEETKTEEGEDEEDTVVLRNKPQGSLPPQQRYSLPEFDIFDSTKRLDTEMLKSRARLGKQGALAQRRKPTKQDPSKRQTWMFGDPNNTKRLLNLEGIDEEETEKPIRARIHSEPEVSIPSPTPKPRKPIGGIGIGGPMLLAGLGGGMPMLKKTPKKSPMEDKPLSVHEDQSSKTESPRLIKPKPARPIPASRPKPSQQPLTSNQPPPWMTKLKKSGTGEKPNHDILNAQREADLKTEEPKVPAWMADAKMRLPPISPKTETKDEESSEKDSDSTNKETTSDMETDSSSTKSGKKPVVIPQWKQELLKKKKDGDATGNKKRHSMPPPVAKKPDTGSSSPFTTMPQWQVDLAEKKNLRKQKETEISNKQESPKVPQWKREAAERAARIQKQQEEQMRLRKEREEKAKTEKKEESAPLSPIQTTPSAIIKNNTEEEEKHDKPKSPSWKEQNSGKEESLEKTKKDKNTENKAPKVPGKKPILSPKPKPVAVQMRTTNNDDVPQWKKDLVKKRRTSDWRSRLRSASIDQEPPSPTSKTNQESNRLNESQNSTSDKETKRHTICTITDLPVKIPRNPPQSTVPQWKIELERKNRRLAEQMAKNDSVPDN